MMMMMMSVSCRTDMLNCVLSPGRGSRFWSGSSSGWDEGVGDLQPLRLDSAAPDVTSVQSDERVARLTPFHELDQEHVPERSTGDRDPAVS